MLYRLLFIGLLNALLLSPVVGNSQFYYWVAFTDKNNSAYSIAHPEEFLSERAIQRRINQNISIDSLDLPVNSAYINQVLELGAEFVHSSKWLNGITVKCNIDSFEHKVLQFPFVNYTQLTKPDLTSKSAVDKFAVPSFSEDTLAIDTSLLWSFCLSGGTIERAISAQPEFPGAGNSNCSFGWRLLSCGCTSGV